MRLLNKKATEIFNRLIQPILADPKKISHVWDEHGYTKKWDGGIMAVHVEHIGSRFGYPAFSIAHYYKQNGDMMRDPEMIFVKVGNQVFPCMFQQDGWWPRYEESARQDEVGGIMLNRKMQRDHAVFAGQWLKNIAMQQSI